MVGKVNFLNKKMVATLKIRSKAINAARQWLNQNAYIEVQGPIIVPGKGEWSGYLKTEVFKKKRTSHRVHTHIVNYMKQVWEKYTLLPQLFELKKTQLIII